MANAAFSAGWNGWVLYTSEEGYKYHWNHLTHESRWATDEAYTQDREAEEYFHDYIHRRLRTIHSPDRRPDNTHGVDAGVDVEQGQDDEEDDDVVASSAFEKQSTTGKLVTPYADIGPITTLAAERCQHRDTGERDRAGADRFTARLTSVLRTATATVECPRQPEYIDMGNSASEWDPELGHDSPPSRRRPTRGDGNNDSSTNSSDSSSTGSDSDSSSTSNSSGGNTSSENEHSRISRHSGTRHCRASRRQSGIKHRASVGSSLTSRNGSSMGSMTGKSSRQGTRRFRTVEQPFQKPERRRKSAGGGLDETRLSERVTSSGNKTSSTAARRMAVEGLADVGRKVVVNVIKIAARAVTGGWMGMTTAAFKIAKAWQTHRAADSGVLPTTVAVNKNTGDHQSGPQMDEMCSYEQIGDRATTRPQGDGQSGPPVNGICSYTPIDGRGMTHPPLQLALPHVKAEYTKHLLAPRWNGGSFERSAIGQVYADRTVVEGLPDEEGEGERGAWVGDGGSGVEESKGVVTPPSRASFLDPSSVDRII